MAAGLSSDEDSGIEVAMIDALLKTKTYLPAVQPMLVPRPRLIERLNEGFLGRDGRLGQDRGFGRKLTLVSAPAGFGKTTLVSIWARQAERPVAWLSLDRGDNDPARFWLYVIAALQTVDATIGETALTALQSPQPPPLEPLVTTLINDVVAASTPLILVLDDYHVIETESIHNSLNFLLDHMPAQLHLAITTRSDPPLFQAHRRGRSEMSEIRAADLRFTIEEAAEFLNTRMGLNLSAEDTAALEDRTEGWVVGLQMAALSLQAMDDKHHFVATFAGDDRYIVDYLVEEVLQRQPPHIQTFLLRTSILERLCGPLCDAVCFGEAKPPGDSAETAAPEEGDGQAVLDWLERANLFIVPLDNRRLWYRYHRLFADLLRHRLDCSASAQEVPSLYLRASEWFEREGLVAEAVSCALASRDYAYAAELIERHVLTAFYRSDTVLVQDWLRALPEDIVRTRPLLCAVYANCVALASRGSFDSPETLMPIERWLQDAEAALAAQSGARPPGEPLPNVAVNFIAKLRAYLAQFRGDDPRTIISLSLEALEGLPEDDLMFHSALTYNLGVGYRRLGDRDAASQAFAQARQIGEASNDLFNASAAIRALADLACTSGRLREAAVICREGLRSIAGLAGGRPIPYAGTICITLGSVLSEWCEFEEAAHTLTRGLALLELTSAPASQQWGHVEMACLRQAQGDTAQALDLLERAARVWTENAAIEAQRVRIWLRQAEKDPHRLDAAVRWTSGRQLQLDGDGDEPDPEQLTLARVILAQHRMRSTSKPSDLHPLLQFLGGQLALAQGTGLLGWEIEVLILQSLALQAQGNVDQAIDSLQRALALAEPEGYARIFVDEGAPMTELLRQAVSRGICPGHVGKLLSVLDAWERDVEKHSLPHPQASLLIEPLTSRELELLQLIVSGASNQEISQELFITVNTVKTHVTHIFGKLGVRRRAQAIARARELGLVE